MKGIVLQTGETSDKLAEQLSKEFEITRESSVVGDFVVNLGEYPTDYSDLYGEGSLYHPTDERISEERRKQLGVLQVISSEQYIKPLVADYWLDL